MRNRLLCAALALAVVAAPFRAEAATTTEERARIWSLAKLVLGPGSDAGLATIRAGVLDPNPDVRAAAGRVARATGAKGVVVELREALSKESDSAAALEILAALADLDDSSESDGALVASVKASDTRQLVLALVAARGPRVAALWPRLKTELEAHASSVARGLNHGFHQSAANVFASYALRDGMEDLYDELLFMPGLVIEPGVVIAGLASPASRIRSSAYIAVADRDLAVRTEPPAFPEATLCERVSRHLFEAARGFARTDALPSLMTALSADPKARTCLRRRFDHAHDSIRGLTPEERGVFLKGVEVDKETADGFIRKVFGGGAASAPSPGRKPPLETISGHAPAFVQSVLEGTGCKGHERSFDGVDIVYGEGGRIRSVLALKSGSSADGCGEAARILGLTSYESEGYAQVTRILPERPEFLACLVETDPVRTPSETPSAGSRVGGSIKEPKKVKSEPPRFPTNPSLAGVDGIVILEALIRPSGCVGGLTVLKGAHPILDLESINAVSGWRYTPTLLNGTAVPVIMTVTVNYRRN